MQEFWKGYVKIRISGDAKERFFNMCRMKKVKMWNLTEEGKDASVVMCMGSRDLLDMKNAIRKSGVRVAVLEKNGLPFFYRKFLKRIVFAVGVLFCISFLIVMMQKIWCIQFEGNSKITNEEMIGFLEERGVVIGCSIRRISYEDLEAELRENFDDITWASVIRKGTTLIIRIKENEFYNQAAVYEDHTDLISEYDGVILSMIVRKGVPLVTIGDEVAKGDILIQGAVPVLDENSEICKYQYCHAEADILIQTHEIYTQTISRVHTVRIYGEERKSFQIGIGTHTLTIGRSVKSGQSLTRNNSHQLVLFEYLYLPFYFNMIEHIPYETVEETYTEEEAEELLRAELEKYLSTLSEKGVQIIQKNVKIIKNGLTMQIEADLTLNRKAGVSAETSVELMEHDEQDDS